MTPASQSRPVDHCPGSPAAGNAPPDRPYPRYEHTLCDYAQGCQKGGDRTGPFLAPGTATGLRVRNGLLNRRWILDKMPE